MQKKKQKILSDHELKQALLTENKYLYDFTFFVYDFNIKMHCRRFYYKQKKKH